MNVTVAAEAGAVVARLACAVIAPLVWRDARRTGSALPSTLRQGRRLIVKTCRQLQQLGLAPRDILRHDGGRATACIVDAVQHAGGEAIAALKAVRLNAEWEAVVTHAVVTYARSIGITHARSIVKAEAAHEARRGGQRSVQRSRGRLR